MRKTRKRDIVWAHNKSLNKELVFMTIYDYLWPFFAQRIANHWARMTLQARTEAHVIRQNFVEVRGCKMRRNYLFISYISIQFWQNFQTNLKNAANFCRINLLPANIWDFPECRQESVKKIDENLFWIAFFSRDVIEVRSGKDRKRGKPWEQWAPNAQVIHVNIFFSDAL